MGSSLPEMLRQDLYRYDRSCVYQGDWILPFHQKHYEDLFPPVVVPSEVLAQAALFIVMRDSPTPSGASSSPWSSLASRRFGGDSYHRAITFQLETTTGDPQTYVVNVVSLANGRFDLSIDTPSSGAIQFHSVPANLSSSSTILTTLNDSKLRTTVVSQMPPSSVPASAHSGERLHVFHEGRKHTLLRPAPKWLQSLGGDVLEAGKNSIRAPMPSLVVDVPVKLGDRVEKGQAVVVLESMKTETVLRAEVSGVVKTVGCTKGEMVEEGRQLIEVEADVEEQAST